MSTIELPDADPPRPIDRRVRAVQRFDRHYGQVLGRVRSRLTGSPFTATEARVVLELAEAPDSTATDLVGKLGLDPGYLSRVISGMRQNGLIRTRSYPGDRRRTLLRLTAAGHGAHAHLERLTGDGIEAILGSMTEERQERFVDALSVASTLLADAEPGPAPYVLHPPEPGDLGWVVQRHGSLYAAERGWDETFEALVADIVVRFVRNHDPRRERCWIAERGGARVGSVMVTKAATDTAQLRCLLVEPSARGLGIGTRLVDECIRFARRTRYARMRLWTDPALESARRIYEAAGFVLAKEEPHDAFGSGLTGQIWEMEL